MVNEVCQARGCGMPVETYLSDGNGYCQHHAEQLSGSTPQRRGKYYHPFLKNKDSVLITSIQAVDGIRATSIPIPPKKKEESEEGEEGGEEVDWITIVGAEPIDDIVEHSNGKDLALSAEYASSHAEIIAPDLAKYLHEHNEGSFDRENRKKAKKYLDGLAGMGVVKKTNRRGENNAVVYSYLEGDTEWWKS